MRSFKLTILIMLTALFTLSCASNKKDEKLAYSHFKLGVTLMGQGKGPQALEQLLIARKLDPTNSLILNHLGLVYFYLKEYEHAILVYKEAIDQKPNYTEAQNNLGRAYIEIKDYDRARHHLTIAAGDLTYNSKDKIWFNLGLTFFEQGRFKKAQQYFLKSISANRKNCLAYNYFGRSQIELEKYKKASKALDQAIYHCRKSGFDEPHYYSAIALFRMGYKAKAIARLDEGRKLNPNGPNKKKIEEMINLMKITDT